MPSSLIGQLLKPRLRSKRALPTYFSEKRQIKVLHESTYFLSLFQWTAVKARLGVLCLLFFCLTGLQAQEICDNGIDDDGDGLIDLWDNDCICNGIVGGISTLDVIPNPDFEATNCCPDDHTQMYCTQDWEPITDPTPDFSHTCGYVFPDILWLGLVPFPSGEGAAGGYIYEGWKETIGVCLDGFLVAGQQHTLAFHIAAFNQGSVCPPLFYPPLAMTLYGYGNDDCALYSSTYDCPPNGNFEWIELGSVYYTPVESWQILEITFTPPINIYGIAIGGPCQLPPGYPDWLDHCKPYMVYDDFSIMVNELVEELDIVVNGDPCNNDLSIFASVNHTGGTWQWYYNNVAMIGENEEVLSVENSQYQSGTFTVIYNTPDGCVMDSVSLIIGQPDTTELDVLLCEGSDVYCSGILYDSPGIYELILTNSFGCDSTVYCTVSEIPASPPVFVEIDTCGPISIQMCYDIISTSGIHEIVCSDYQGCDSIIYLDIRIMEPEAIIQTPEFLPCISNPSILLDGSLSTLNGIPDSTASYFWTGPANGINGGTNGPFVSVVLPGIYCLTVIYERNGVLCSDMTCDTVFAAQQLPDEPTILGPPSGCTGDTLSFSLISQGNIPATGYTWVVPSGFLFQIINDSTLLYFGSSDDTLLLCGYTNNECGTSDTVCSEVITTATSSTNQIESTCDPLQAGVFTDTLQNQFGCDSLVMRTVNSVPSHLEVMILSTCDSTQTSSDTLFLTNQFGCDSLRITQYNVLPKHSFHLTENVCDVQEVGMDTVIMINQYGCDSIQFIDRIYTGVFQEETHVQICGAGNSFSDTLHITGGSCDSFFITNYSYLQVDSIFLSETTCDIANAGVQQYFFQNQFGCDSTVWITVMYEGIDTQFIQNYTCDSNQVGIQIVTIPGIYCDTVIVENTLWSSFSIGYATIYSCDLTGPAADTMLITQPGNCDSLHIRTWVYNDLAGTPLIFDERCAGEQNGQLIISGVIGGLPPFQYQLNGSPWQNDTLFTGLAPGNYTLTVRDDRGCTRNYSGLTVQNGQVLTVEAGPDQIVVPGEYIDLSAQATVAIQEWLWIASDPLSCATCPQTILGPIQSAQTVFLTVLSTLGCPGSDVLQVTLSAASFPEVFIPASFSPNNDGINDVFSVYGNDQVLRVRNMAVYDRWGNALFSRADLPVNDPSQGWDGNFRDQLMDPGVYVYVIKVELTDGTERLYKGDVTLMR